MLSNSDQKHITKLHQKKYRERYGEFIVEGGKGVAEAVESAEKVISIVVEEDKEDDFNEIINRAGKRGVSIKTCSEQEANKIKTTKTFPGIICIVKKDQFSLGDLKDDNPIICLDRISDPGNLGTIIRTADWFGIYNILISEESVEAYNEKVVRSSMGSIFRSKIVESENIISDLEELKQNGYNIAGLDLEGKNIKNEALESKGVYIFGSESHGISNEVEKMLDNRYTIEGKGNVESLNIAISAGIVLYNLNN